MTSCAATKQARTRATRNTRRTCARPGQSERQDGRPGQKFPRPESNGIATNAALADLRRSMRETSGEGYAYQITTVKPYHGRFMQIGSAPNIEGGLVTLCTCKHYMRSGRDVKDWPGHWIAGFTSVGRNGWDKHYLIYAMRVSHAFESQAELWAWLEVRRQAASKSADQNRYGDVYRPIDPAGDAHDWRNYHPPIDEHPHSNPEQWHRDIRDETALRWLHRFPALLVGDPHLSFVWDRPMLYLPGKLARTKRFTLGALLSDLSEIER